MDYFMIDYAFVTAYNNLPYVREMIEEIPPMPNRFLQLLNMRNEAFSESTFIKITEEMPFFKMTYKENFWKKLKRYTSDGKLTYYGYLTQEEAKQVK